MILTEQRGDVAVLRLEHGKVNALDVELLAALGDRLEEIEASSARAVVLTGSGTVFSAGVDLFRVLDGGRPYVQELMATLERGLTRLFGFPRPVVAAVNGHAIAGGWVLSCACDLRLLAEGPFRVGVPELLVGVPFPLLALEVVRFASPPQLLQEMVYTGRTYSVAEALARGMAEEAAPPEALLDRAIELAARLGAIPADAYRVTKAALRRPVLERCEREAAAVDAVALELWVAPAAQQMIRDYLGRTLGKGR